ncbi:CLOCK-interacting pacemaker isoform X2 [Pseudochaenichthys georgianus]|uniref:CLOCK-interacting pacemaker isoform X2 n=1 Tax=Pseudochaenichthys georgianus TaxID=52239 RepID=UPI00146C47F2|nr:CLOCK-interacting pacemaker isoform X2 [Pseudochaenichthys georgianus]
MPKEAPCLSEHNPSASSSKNAKNKSNSLTLMAMRETKDVDDSSGTGSRCSSEKDSGYSDGSDWQQTDVEDQRSEQANTSQTGQTKDLQQGNPGSPMLKTAGRELQPIYIINNMVLKKPDMIEKKVQLSRRNGSRGTGSSGFAHMIHSQHPRLLPASRELHKPLSRKSHIIGKKINDTYLPILNSYPRIAPHPSKTPPDKSVSNDASQNLSKRVCTNHMNEEKTLIRSLPEQHLHEQPKEAVLTHGLPCPSSTSASSSSPTTVSSSPTTVSSSQGAPSGSTLHHTSSNLTSRGPHQNGTISTRHLRFLNTVQILRQSGLLDITLRTKELLRQSNATEQNIAQLRQHTELLCRAASDAPHSLSSTWEHLHRDMAMSGSYPNLKTLQNVQIPYHIDSSQPVSFSTGGSYAAEGSSHLHSTVPDPNSEKGREIEGDRNGLSENVTFTPPDSSTG